MGYEVIIGTYHGMTIGNEAKVGITGFDDARPVGLTGGVFVLGWWEQVYKSFG